jgi:Holliday junction resolvase RusA-like endonuclease
MSVIISIPGVPVAKARARFARAGRFTRTYDPQQQTTDWARLSDGFAKAKDELGGYIDGPVAIDAVFVFPIPGSWSRKKKAAAEAGLMPHDIRPDIDNLLKTVMDLGNVYLWRDDKIVARVTARKVYGTDPKTSLLISRLGEGV